MEQSPNLRRLERSAALLIAFAGVVHLIIVPMHWAHAPAHGLFFAVVGIAEIVWSVAAWRRPSTLLYGIGLIGAGGLVVLWTITRVLPAPFGHGPESVETFGIICKLSEGVGMVVLALMISQQTVVRAGRSAAWRTTGSLVVVALLIGFLMYGVARASEPALPWLASPTEHDLEHHHEESAPAHHHEDSTTATPEHEGHEH